MSAIEMTLILGSVLHGCKHEHGARARATQRAAAPGKSKRGHLGLAQHCQALYRIDAVHHLRSRRHQLSRQIFITRTPQNPERDPRRRDVGPRARAADGGGAEETAGPGGVGEVPGHRMLHEYNAGRCGACTGRSGRTRCGTGPRSSPWGQSRTCAEIVHKTHTVRRRVERSALVHVGADAGDTRHAEVPWISRVTERFSEGQHEATKAGVDVQREVVLQGERTDFLDGVDHAVHVHEQNVTRIQRGKSFTYWGADAVRAIVLRVMARAMAATSALKSCVMGTCLMVKPK